MHNNIHSLSLWVLISTLIHLIAFILVCLHCLKRRRNPSATMLWIFTAWSFPLFGPLLYLSFGVDRVPEKGLEKFEADQIMKKMREVREKEDRPLTTWDKHRSDPGNYGTELGRRIHMLMDAVTPDHPLLNNNMITPLLCGDEAYPAMKAAIEQAEHHIHLQTFIFNRDDTGREFLELLKKKAEAGVHVRLLFDRFGSTHALLGGLFRKYQRVPNLEIKGWTQANPLKRQFQVNLRNHRKNLIVDGRVAFFGGVNISSENTTLNAQPPIRDYHFKVEGPLVHELQYAFLRDWHFMTGTPPADLLSTQCFPVLEPVGTAQARIIDSGPSSRSQVAVESFFNAIVMAQQQLLLVTPYFVPTSDIMQALRSAAQRGVDVRLVVPQKNNHHYAGMASRSLYEDLLKTGVRIFERQPPFIHAKAMLVDGAIAIVGTANIDVRSLELNYETCVLVSDDVFANRMKQIILEDIGLSREINLNEWIQRPSYRKLAENLCSLMTPIL
ncbi:MAG: cardiolipin synthase [Kiritimatiellales bacterium]|nr:cardiolipin synthase [Kiritimatiellales bacterium]